MAEVSSSRLRPTRRQPDPRTVPARSRSKADPRPKKASDTTKLAPSKGPESPSALIDAKIEALGDWRGELLARIRALVKEAAPHAVEEWKWRGTPVWSDHGLICTGETYKSVVKMTFAKGAFLDDPTNLFNSSLEGNTRRAIDFHEGEAVNARALKALIRSAAALNKASGRG